MDNPNPSAEEHIETRLHNSMHQLEQELAASGIDLKAVSCVFTVTWQGGQFTIGMGTPLDNAAPTGKRTKPSE